MLANGSLSSKSGGEGEIRKRLVEADLVDCIVAMPDKLFFNTGIPVCLWLISKSRGANGHPPRTGQVLFIDARSLGRLESRRLRLLDDSEIERIAGTYHLWRSQDPDYVDIPGFCKSASTATIEQHDFVLTPGRYVAVQETAANDEPARERIARLTADLRAEFHTAHQLEAEILGHLEELSER